MYKYLSKFQTEGCMMHIACSDRFLSKLRFLEFMSRLRLS